MRKTELCIFLVIGCLAIASFAGVSSEAFTTAIEDCVKNGKMSFAVSDAFIRCEGPRAQTLYDAVEENHKETTETDPAGFIWTRRVFGGKMFGETTACAVAVAGPEGSPLPVPYCNVVMALNVYWAFKIKEVH